MAGLTGGCRRWTCSPSLRPCGAIYLSCFGVHHRFFSLPLSLPFLTFFIIRSRFVSESQLGELQLWEDNVALRSKASEVSPVRDLHAAFHDSFDMF